MGKIVELKQVVELKVPTTSINMVDVNASIIKNKVTKVCAFKEHKSWKNKSLVDWIEEERL